MTGDYDRDAEHRRPLIEAPATLLAYEASTTGNRHAYRCGPSLRHDAVRGRHCGVDGRDACVALHGDGIFQFDAPDLADIATPNGVALSSSIVRTISVSVMQNGHDESPFVGRFGRPVTTTPVSARPSAAASDFLSALTCGKRV